MSVFSALLFCLLFPKELETLTGKGTLKCNVKDCYRIGCGACRQDLLKFETRKVDNLIDGQIRTAWPGFAY
jgi:hypothetical protein